MKTNKTIAKNADVHKVYKHTSDSSLCYNLSAAQAAIEK